MRTLISVVLGLLLPVAAAAETEVSVVGLFPGKAVLIINGGKPRTLAAGQSADGVKLLSADSNEAVLEVEGRRRQLGMGQGASVAGSASSEQTALLYANPDGHFLADGSINGQPVRFLVDTGATTVALSGDTARRLGINYRDAPSGFVHTASGNARAYRVNLNSLKIGGITLHQVESVVLEGSAPSVALLGMTVLNRLDMRRDGIALTLTKKY